MSRSLPEEAYNAVKTGWKLLVRDIGGVDAVAACTRASRSLVSEYGNPASDRWVPADTILDAETIAGRPLVTAALARAGGFALMPITPRSAGELAAKMAEIARYAAELFATSAIALTHPRLAENEREALCRELDELIRAAAETRALILGPPAPLPLESNADRRVPRA